MLQAWFANPSLGNGRGTHYDGWRQADIRRRFRHVFVFGRIFRRLADRSPGPNAALGFLLVGSGVGAGIGGFLGWLKPEVSKPVLAIHVILVLAGGVAGSWCGWVLSQMLFPEGMYNPGVSFRTPPFIGAIVIAALGTNLFAGIFYIFRAWRFREY